MMGRLTKRTANGGWSVDGDYCYSVYADYENPSPFAGLAIDKLAHYEDAEEQNRLIILPSVQEDLDAPLREKMSDLLEPLKLKAAFDSERLKLELRKETRPEDVSILDYTIMAALLYVLADKECPDEEEVE